jgi:hypothetical protein
MNTKTVVYALPALILIAIQLGEAQQTKVPRIGYLATAPLSAIATRVEAFRQGLRELGYVEGKNILIEWRSAPRRKHHWILYAVARAKRKTHRAYERDNS